MWEIMGPILEQYGLPVGLLICMVVGLAWAWKRERDDNRKLNEKLQESAKTTTAALVAVKDASQAQEKLLGALANRFEKLHDMIISTASTQHEQSARRLEAIEKKLLELATKLE
jgi:biopolymer transport protein ExbB/TolQ